MLCEMLKSLGCEEPSVLLLGRLTIGVTLGRVTRGVTVLSCLMMILMTYTVTAKVTRKLRKKGSAA